VKCKAVIGLGSLEEMSKLDKLDDGGVEIGAMITLRNTLESKLLAQGWEVIVQGAKAVSSMQVRNVATIGGNACNAAPSADTVPGLIVSEAVAMIAGPNGERHIPLEDFFLGPEETVLGTGELLAGFYIPGEPGRSGGAYKKFAIRGSTDIAIASVGVQVAIDERNIVRKARIALGAVGPIVMRARRAEAILEGNTCKKDDLIEEAAREAQEEAKPISDQRATALYRKEMVRVWTRYAVEEAITKAESSG